MNLSLVMHYHALTNVGAVFSLLENRVNLSTADTMEDGQPFEASPPRARNERELLDWLVQLKSISDQLARLRSLIPTRLLAPLTALKGSSNSDEQLQNPGFPDDPNTTDSVATDPAVLELAARLQKCAAEATAEVNNFKQSWTSHEMRSLWQHVEQKLHDEETSVDDVIWDETWNEDYEDLLRRHDQHEEGSSEGNPSTKAVDEERMFAQLVGGWEACIASLNQELASRLEFRDVSSGSDDNDGDKYAFTVLVKSVSLPLRVRMQREPNPEWVVNLVDGQQQEQQQQQQQDKSKSELQRGIFAAINGRDRRWDLYFLVVGFSRPPQQSTSISNSSRETCSTCSAPIPRFTHRPALTARKCCPMTGAPSCPSSGYCRCPSLNTSRNGPFSPARTGWLCIRPVIEPDESAARVRKKISFSCRRVFMAHTRLYYVPIGPRKQLFSSDLLCCALQKDGYCNRRRRKRGTRPSRAHQLGESCDRRI